MSEAPDAATLFHPRQWPIWLAVGLLRLSVRLPIPWLRGIARPLGRLFMRLGKRRVEIARINIELCFPELDAEERAILVRRHFEAAAIGLLELALAWWAPRERLLPLVEVHGLEHLKAALAEGRGVILVSAHFTTLEIGGRLLAEAAPDLPLKAMYRPNENPVLERQIRGNREARFGEPIKRDDIRGVLQALRRGEAVWYASDQNYGHQHSVFAPFFGIPAATNTATSRIARSTGATVVPFFTRRLPDGRYKQVIEPALGDFPSDDPAHDAARLNQLIERWVRQAPEQYFWMHRRFKDRPGDEPRFY